MTCRRRMKMFAMVSMAIALPGLAHAQQSSHAHGAPTSGATSDAEQRHAEGKEAANRGDANLAMVKFRQAYAADPKPDYLWDLALTELDAHFPVQAADHFRAYIADPRGDAKTKQQAKDLLTKELWPVLGHLRVHAPPGTFIRLD